jgi:tetratricopeptide (TPR) repeat protein
VQQNRTTTAVQEISSYTNTPGANSTLYVLLAQLHILQDNLPAAKTDCQNALRLDEKSAHAYFFLGRIAELQGNEGTAIADYARAGDLNQADSLPDLLAGDLSEKLQRWSDAQKYYQRALQQSPGMARAQAGLARTMIELGGDSNVALGLAQQALSSDPSDPILADDLGWVYFKKGLFQLAIPLLKQAVEEMPQAANIHFHLGMAYSAGGDKSEARLALLDARKLGLSETEAKQAQETLAMLSAPSNSHKTQ